MAPARPKRSPDEGLVVVSVPQRLPAPVWRIMVVVLSNGDAVEVGPGETAEIVYRAGTPEWVEIAVTAEARKKRIPWHAVAVIYEETT